MGKLFTVCFLLLGTMAHSQDLIPLKDKGATRAVAQETGSLKGKGATRAVIVGISDYQDPQIIDLSYAHRDADSFAVFLKSNSGGRIDDQHIQLLANNQATIARIQSAMEWLLKNTEPGDQAILYFSGHGDVETKNDQEKGYILAYDTPKNNYRLNAVDLDYLNKNIIGQLSQKGAKVIVITDACHSGALAGGAEGKEATASELMKRFKSEIKIMSCQPYELSQESSRWGGGRGVFSYFLIEGLQGFADEDNDYQVDLYELEHFLQDRVRSATDKAQHPDVLGGQKEEALFMVDEATLAALSGVQKLEIESDFEKKILNELASEQGFMNYLNFNAALKKGDLLSPEGNSAVYYYDALYADPAFTPLRGIIGERLTIAFMDSVQQAINAYLNTDPQELAQRNRFDQKYARFSEYLRRTAQILGAKDSRFQQTLAKQYYFEGLGFRLTAEQTGGSDSLYRLALEKQEKALELEKNAAYIYNELGFLYLELDSFDQGMNCLRKAVEISPTWAIPYNNLAIGYKAAGSLDQAKGLYQKAIALKPDFASAYTNLGNLFFKLDQTDSAELAYRKGIELDSGIYDNYYDLALLLSEQEERRGEAKAYFYQALARGSNAAETCFELGKLYEALEQPDSAEILFRRVIVLKPADAAAYQKLGEVLYLHNGPAEETEKILLRAIALNPAGAQGFLFLGLLYLDSSRPEAAEKALLGAIRCDSTLEFAYTSLVGLYRNQWETALALLRRAPLDTRTKIRVWCDAGLGFADAQAFADALKAFDEAARLDPAEPLVFFTRCTYHALRGQAREALDNLDRALQKAKARKTAADYFEQLMSDTELDPLRQHPRFRSIMKRYFPGKN